LCLVLIGLRAPLQEFDTFPLTLRFDKADAITVEVTVEEPGAAEPREDYGL
jgi:copper(I)-binding protein